MASEVTETAVFDVQPLGWLDSAVINVAAGQPITVAVLDAPDLFSLVDLESIAFFGATPLHANVLHFDLDLSAYGDGDVVSMCLTGNFLEVDAGGTPVPVPDSWCADVTVKNRGGGPAQ